MIIYRIKISNCNMLTQNQQKSINQINLIPSFSIPKSTMSNQKQKLAQMVLQKMKQKKQAEQKARPHFQVLQLNVLFSLEQNQQLKTQIDTLTQTLKKQNHLLSELKLNLQELQNTGKKSYPVIIVKPQFIASQNVTTTFKQFYRKASNTFLKTELIKTQKYEVYLEKQKQILSKMDSIVRIQDKKYQQFIKHTKKLHQKRTKVLKQDIRRRKMINQQDQIENQIKSLRSQNLSLLRQYEIKKQNLQNRMSYSQNLTIKIQQQKQKIQKKYNPLSYREYLKKVFDVRIKNQHLQKSLFELLKKLNQSQKKSEKYKIDLQKRCSVNFIGKSSDSPSKIRGKLQNNLQKQNQRKSNTNPKVLTDMISVSLKQNNNKSERYTRRSHSTLNEVNGEFNSVQKLIKKKGGQIRQSYSSMKTLKGLHNTIKSDRTLSTTFALSSAKKRFIDF